jgi:hypothetical protein
MAADVQDEIAGVSSIQIIFQREGLERIRE